MPEIASAKLSIRPEALPRGGARVLDVGCGDGRHVAVAAGRGCRTVGLDYDHAELRRTRARAAGGDLIVGDAALLPFRDGAFDAVICTETLEHLRDDCGAMLEIARVLRVDGVLHAAVPSHFTELLYWKLSPGYRHAPGGHVRIYTPRAVASMLRRARLQMEELRYVHFIDSLLWLRYCLTDFLRRGPRTDLEAAVMLAVAAERGTPAWRRRIRAGIGGSRFIAALDVVGAMVWPKSLAFMARKRSGPPP